MEETVDVVTSNGDDLCSFMSFVEKQEVRGVGSNDGVFKLVIDSSIERETSSSTILLQVVNNVKNVDSQHVLLCGAKGIYQYHKNSAMTHVTKKFIKDSSDLSSYSEETCCLQILQTSGVQEVLHHFFNNVNQSTAWSHDHSERNLLIEGSLVRQQYEDFVKAGLPFSSSVKQTTSQCQCIDCIQYLPQNSNVTNKNPILYAAGIVLKNDPPISIVKGFSLGSIQSLLSFTKYHYEGLSTSYFYLGSKHSFFVLHVEDALLWSINYLHFGLPKIWVVIPPKALLFLNYQLSKSGLTLSNTSCLNILGHKTVLPSLQWLDERAIPYKMVVQHPGEAAILYPGAAHFGLNTGWNVAEAINFATVSWIEDGINAPRCTCYPGQIHLDLSTFVAAFRPDLLNKFLNRQFIESEKYMENISFFHDSMKRLCERDHIVSKCVNVSNKRGTSTKQPRESNPTGKSIMEELCCPAPFCKRQFPLRQQQSLFKHVMNDHRPIMIKCQLMEKISLQILKVKNKKQNSSSTDDDSDTFGTSVWR